MLVPGSTLPLPISLEERPTLRCLPSVLVIADIAKKWKEEFDKAREHMKSLKEQKKE